MASPAWISDQFSCFSNKSNLCSINYCFLSVAEKQTNKHTPEIKIYITIINNNDYQMVRHFCEDLLESDVEGVTSDSTAKQYLKITLNSDYILLHSFVEQCC